MQTTIPCPNCKKATLTAELFGIVHLEKDMLQGDYATQCHVCGQASGFVIFRPEPVAVSTH
jgi:hypothetical protein